MASYSVLTTFRAIDQMSSPLKRMHLGAESLNTSVARIQRSGRKMGDAMSPVTNILGRVGNLATSGLGLLGIGTGIGAVAGGFMKLVSEASKIEDATARFTPLMGSVDKAKKLVDELNITAAATPFQFEGIAGVAGQLLPVMNGNIKSTIDTFKMLGDTAGGNIEKLDTITRGYVKAMLKGKPDMESMNMIAEAGVPIYAQLAKSMGISTKEMFELSKAGKLTNKDLTKAFEMMTSEGGIFFKGMDISSKTFTGIMSTVKDNIAMAAAKIGTKMLPALKDFANQIISFLPKITAWADANGELINQKVISFLNGLKKLGKSIYDNWGTIEAIFTGVGTAIMFAADNFKLIATGIGIFAAVKTYIMLAAVGMEAYTIATSLAAIATNALALPLWAVVAVVAALASTLYVVYQHWGKIISAFSSGDILGGLKAIGAMLIDLVLWPLEQIMKVIDMIPGFGGGADMVHGWREGVGAVDKKTATESLAKKPVVTPESASAQATAEYNRTTTTNKNSTVKIDWSGIPNNAKVMVNGKEMKRPANTLNI